MTRQQQGTFRTSMYWVLAVLAGLFLFIAFNYNDLSSTKGQVKVGKRQAESIASTFWSKRQVNPGSFQRTAILQDDTAVDGYISLHHLEKSYEKQFSHIHPLQYWEVTYYRPHDTKQYFTRINPFDGTVIGFGMHSSIASPYMDTGQMIDSAKAYAVEQLKQLQQQQPRQNVDIVYIGKSRESDGLHFTFADKQAKIGQAPMQVHVQVFAGTNQPNGFATSFAVPKADRSWFALQSKRSKIMTWVFMIGQFLLFVGALLVLYRKRRQGVRYGRGFPLLVLAFVLDLLINVNTLPQLQSQMGFAAIAARGNWMSDGWIGFFVEMTAILEVGMLYFITVAGGALAKDVMGEERWLSWRHPDWPIRVRNAAFRGYGIAIIWLGLQTLFYWIGQTYFHVWEQNDMGSSPWNNVVPALIPAAAWFAGINEEITFRLFGYGLLKKLFKKTWLALLIPAMIWALGHSLYPVYPVYTRFVELTIFGTLIGWCMLKWDLETVIFAHISFDSILMSLSLLSDQPVRMAPAAIFWAILPLLAGVAASSLQRMGKHIFQKDLISR